MLRCAPRALFSILSIVLTGILMIACAGKSEDPPPEPPAPAAIPPSRFLYVSSGLCQAGLNTTFTAVSSSNVVYRVNLETGQRDMILADYNSVSGESPVGIVDYDTDHLLVAIEKSTGRRIEKLQKRLNGLRSNFSTDSAGALQTALLSMARGPDGTIYLSRTAAISAISSGGTTISASFLSNNIGGGAGACGTTNAKYSSVAVTSLGHLVVMNSENNDNKIAIVKNGSTCLAGQTPTPTNALSTAAVWIPGANQIIAGYSGPGAAVIADNISTLQVYDVTETASPAAATLSAPTEIYDTADYPGISSTLLFAVPAMTYDSETGFLYVASANRATSNNITTAGNYVIEKFSYNPSTKTLQRVGSEPFYQSGVDTRCISSMFIGY